MLNAWCNVCTHHISDHQYSIPDLCGDCGLDGRGDACSFAEGFPGVLELAAQEYAKAKRRGDHPPEPDEWFLKLNQLGIFIS